LLNPWKIPAYIFKQWLAPGFFVGIRLVVMGLQEGIQPFERLEDGRRRLPVLGRRSAIIAGQYEFLVFVVVTVQAQQLPVPAIGWIIVMIVVFVMHRQFAESLAGKLAPTPRRGAGKSSALAPDNSLVEAHGLAGAPQESEPVFQHLSAFFLVSCIIKIQREC
jgi:hypothetical protein